MRRPTAQGAEPCSPRAPTLEARGTAVRRRSLIDPRHWLLRTLLLLGAVLWASIPAFADPGHTLFPSVAGAHASPGETPDPYPGRPQGGKRGESEVEVEDERGPESHEERGLFAHSSGLEISIFSRNTNRIDPLWWVERSHAAPLTGGGCIRGPPSAALQLRLELNTSL